MSFIQREIDRLSAALAGISNDHEASQPLFAAKQALVWALEPEGFASPSAMLHRYFGVGDDGTKGTGMERLDGPREPATSN